MLTKYISKRSAGQTLFALQKRFFFIVLREGVDVNNCTQKDA